MIALTWLKMDQTQRVDNWWVLLEPILYGDEGFGATLSKCQLSVRGKPSI